MAINVIHGFNDRDHGEIDIIAFVKDGVVKMWFEDDGVGMPKELVEIALDPFFTIRQGSGGTGFGRCGIDCLSG